MVSVYFIDVDFCQYIGRVVESVRLLVLSTLDNTVNEGVYSAAVPTVPNSILEYKY